MRTLIKLLPLYILFVFNAQAEPQQETEESWFLLSQGYCQEKSPMEMVAWAKLGGVRIDFKDVKEKGVVVSTIVTLTGRHPSDRESFRFYRGEQRCNEARDAEDEKFKNSMERYR